MACRRASRSAISWTRPCASRLRDGLADFAAGEVFNDGLEGRILLAHDVVEARGLDAGLLKLLIRSARVDRLVLTDIADEQDAVFGSETLEEVVHLPRAGETRFVEHIEAPAFVRFGVGSGEMALQCAGRHAGLRQLLGRPRGRRESFDRIPFALGGVPNGRERRRLAGAGDTFERLT